MNIAGQSGHRYFAPAQDVVKKPTAPAMAVLFAADHEMIVSNFPSEAGWI